MDPNIPIRKPDIPDGSSSNNNDPNRDHDEENANNDLKNVGNTVKNGIEHGGSDSGSDFTFNGISKPGKGSDSNDGDSGDFGSSGKSGGNGHSHGEKGDGGSEGPGSGKGHGDGHKSHSLNPFKRAKENAKGKLKKAATGGVKRPGKSKTAKDGAKETDPVSRALTNMMANAGKGTAKKFGKGAAPIAAGVYAANKFFNDMLNRFGLMMGQLGQGIQNALVNSPLGHLVDFAGNLAHGIGQTAGAVGHAIGGAVSHGLGALGHGLGAIGHGIANIGSGIAQAATAGVHALANGLGMSVASAGVMSGGITGLIVVAVVGGFITLNQSNGIKDADQPNQCKALVDAAQTGGGKIDTSKQESAEAQKIYSAFKVFGLNDNQIAGILGCWGRESHVDPTSIEGIFDEPYRIGPRKKAALSNLSSYTSKVSTGSSQYTNGGACPGLGLGQWTGGNGLKLMAAAKHAHKKWYDLDFQIAYVMSTPTPTGMSADSFWKGMKHTNSVSAAVDYFLVHWEGVPGNAEGERIGYANSFVKQEKNWKINSSYAHSILAMAKSLGAAATEKAVSDAAQSCADAQLSADNSQAVNAALSYAWDNEKLATGNNGTKLYQTVHKQILPGDPFFMSCDRNVALAERWSGTDISYPAGPTGAQLKYLEGSPKWKHIGNTKSIKYSDLKPGDVMCKNGHTYLYVGNKAVLASIKRGQHKASKVPANADDVDASYGERSAGIGTEARYSVIDHGDGPYEVFRNIKSDHSSKYKSIGAHVNN